MKTERNILIAFLLNLAFSAFEVFGGIFTGSVAILADALAQKLLHLRDQRRRVGVRHHPVTDDLGHEGRRKVNHRSVHQIHVRDRFAGLVPQNCADGQQRMYIKEEAKYVDFPDAIPESAEPVHRKFAERIEDNWREEVLT